MGISEYTLSNALPNEIKTSLPTIEELEAELNEVWYKFSDEDKIVEWKLESTHATVSNNVNL